VDTRAAQHRHLRSSAKKSRPRSADELRTFVKSQLADHKAPSHVMFVEAFPLTGSGKLQRFKLREEFLGSPRWFVALPHDFADRLRSFWFFPSSAG
jgi:acyl-coenzyme A synthetase/AMP-(fatty) acid ligase